MPRNANETKARILEAAFREFVDHGRAGARVDRIAEKACCNKSMIYQYFGNKDSLFDALIEQQTNMTADLSDASFGTVEAAISGISSMVTEDMVRFSTWEALEGRGKNIPGEKERRKVWRSLIDQVQGFIDSGQLPSRLKATHLELAGCALFIFPAAFPQITKLIIGRSPHNPTFQAEWREFLGEVLKMVTSHKN